MALTKFNFNSFDVTTAASKGLAFNSDADGFETSTPGSMTLIKTLTASSSATLSFVDGSSDVVLDSTYPVYVFKCINIHASSSGENFHLEGSTDTGSSYGITKTTTQFQAKHNEADNDTALQYSTAGDLAQSTSPIDIGRSINTGNDECLCADITIFNPSSTTFVKHFISVENENYTGTGILQNYTAGYFNTTSAIDAFKFSFSGGNIDAGTIKLYGIKDS